MAYIRTYHDRPIYLHIILTYMLIFEISASKIYSITCSLKYKSRIITSEILTRTASLLLEQRLPSGFPQLAFILLGASSWWYCTLPSALSLAKKSVGRCAITGHCYKYSRVQCRFCRRLVFPATRPLPLWIYWPWPMSVTVSLNYLMFRRILTDSRGI